MTEVTGVPKAGYYAEVAASLNGWYSVHRWKDGEYRGMQHCATIEFAYLVQQTWEETGRGV